MNSRERYRHLIEAKRTLSAEEMINLSRKDITSVLFLDDPARILFSNKNSLRRRVIGLF